MDCGESSDNVNGSGASSKKWKYEIDNGQGGTAGVQYSLYLHMSPSYKFCEVGKSELMSLHQLSYYATTQLY